MEAPVNRAFVGEYTVYAFHRFPYVFRRPKGESDVNSANYQNAFLGFNFSANVSRKTPFVGIYFARFQRATKGSNHSPGSRRHNVINRRCVGFADFAFINAIMLGYRAMDAERHRLFFSRQICKA
jgi:hypothetical protein